MFVLDVLGGLCLFLYGLNNLSEGLRHAFKKNTDKLLLDSRKNIFLYFLSGIFVTSIIQSSSATSVMVIALTNGGLISLNQGVSIIFGANIGTTVTTHLLKMDLEELVLPSIFFGFLINLLGKRSLGDCLMGFGIAFLGINILHEHLWMLRNNPAFFNFIVRLSQAPKLALISGALFTAIFQSSSAGMGFLISMIKNNLVDLNTSILIMFGLNIGTCTTAFIASIHGKKNGKRIALAHFIFNAVGVLIFLLFFDKFIYTINYMLPQSNIVKKVSLAHTLFNVVNALLFLPFINGFVKMLYVLIPENKNCFFRK